MAKKNEFTYKKGCQYINWLCISNKLFLLRDDDNISDEDKASISRALKCKTGDILCLVLGRNISYFGYSKLIEDMEGRTTESIVQSKNPVFLPSTGLVTRKRLFRRIPFSFPGRSLRSLSRIGITRHIFNRT